MRHASEGRCKRWARAALVGLLAIGFVSVGCGDGAAGGPGPIPTSVPGNKRFSDLTPAERGQYCADFGAWAMSGPFLTATCNVDGWFAAYLESVGDPAVTDADLRTTCAGIYAQCVANGVTITCDTSTPSTCTATVSEYDACAVEAVTALGELPGCSAVTRASLAPAIDSLMNQSVSPMCMAVAAKCPPMM